MVIVDNTIFQFPTHTFGFLHYLSKCMFSWRSILFLVFVTALVNVTSAPVSAQTKSDLGPLAFDSSDVSDQYFPAFAIKTDSPRHTLESFVRLREELETVLQVYPSDKTTKKAVYIEFLFDQFQSLMDMSAVPEASRRETGIQTISALLDILGRVGLPDATVIPSEDAFEDVGFAQYRIPGTPIHITRIEQGFRKSEYLFNQSVTLVAPRFLKGVEELPLKSKLNFTSWTAALPQFTGPMIPNYLVLALPDSLLRFWMDTPIWKVLFVILLTMASAALFWALHIVVEIYKPKGRMQSLLINVIRPATLLVLFSGLYPYFVHYQINTSGVFSVLIENVTVFITYVSIAWLFWLIPKFISECIIASPMIPDDSLDANLLRLVAGSIGVFSGVGIMAFCGQKLGLPIVSIMAGLGVGGLAIALAIRPTLENLIGGFILYMDQPVRVGDYCTFGDKGGVVTSIGIRSTKLEALDKTIITVPNAQFSDMEIINWSKSDVLILKSIGLRYETDLDQLRYILAKTVEMLHAHPKIDSDTVRARFDDFGAYSLNFTIRVFVKTRNWNEYYAVQEDLLFRIGQIIEDAGASFAYPSQTLYIGRDNPPTQEIATKVKKEVNRWRQNKQFPFPLHSASKLDKIADTLRYPPPGSPDANDSDDEFAQSKENLSAEYANDTDIENEDKQNT